MHRSSEALYFILSFLRLISALNIYNISAYCHILIIKAILITNLPNIFTVNYVSYTISFATVPKTLIGLVVVLKEEFDIICALFL